MDDSFQLLEDKVRRAAEIVSRLRTENEELKAEAARLRPRLREAEERIEALEQTRGAEAGEARKLEALDRELRALRGEREEVRRRIAKLVEVLDGL